MTEPGPNQTMMAGTYEVWAHVTGTLSAWAIVLGLQPKLIPLLPTEAGRSEMRIATANIASDATVQIRFAIEDTRGC